MTIFYRCLYFIVVHLLLPWLYPVSAKLKNGYLLRQKSSPSSPYPWLLGPRGQKPLWFHCASGEFEYALPLIREIKVKDPNQKIMVTYFTPSYVEKIKSEPLVDAVFPAPWDEPHILQTFIEYHQPKALLIARTDVWFEMTRQCHLKKIPVFIFSMTFHKTIPLWENFFLRWKLQFVDHFFVVSSDDQNGLKKIVPSQKISISGDTRYDQCLFRLSLNKPLPLTIQPSTKATIVAGSLWSEDEDVLIPTIPTIAGCRWILVPHEVDSHHIEQLIKKLDKIQKSYQLASQISDWDGSSVLIVDRVGCLAELYKEATISFVGGSFRQRVHSVMEPLACGSLTFVGPYYQNNREAIEFSRDPLQAVRIVHSRQDLSKALQEALRTWGENQKAQLQGKMSERAGVSKTLARTIFQTEVSHT